ncbi:MAG: DNA repair protein RecO [Immundisolibacteraceae bacterium]|nr:DNA repair protein RecO [Immundisolibacteraceae bacterium]
MAQSKIEGQPAYLLHSRPYRDTSALLELWTLEFGRVGLVARGARGARSPWRGALNSFQPLQVAWSGGGDLKSLRGLELDGMVEVPTGEPLAAAYYVNELILRTCQRLDAHPNLYLSYVTIMTALAASEAAEPGVVERALRAFEIDLLAELGYGVIVDADQSGATVIPQADYCYVQQQGPVSWQSIVAAGDEGNYSGIPVTGELLINLHSGRLDDDQLPAAKRLMRTLLQPHLGDKPLESRRLWAAISKTGKVGETGH